MIKHTKSYLKGHPDPQFSRKDFINLNGPWQFIFDDNNEGLLLKYFNNFPSQSSINVPVSFEYPASGINNHDTHNVVWYKKEFTINNQNKQKKLLLHFEGVDYEARVFVNGHYVGKHEGAYSRFSFDISQFVHEGENNIVVRVYDDYNCTHSRGKQRWMDHNYECFYRETTGIWKTVWLEFVASTHLQNVYMHPSYENGNIEIEYNIDGDISDCELETIISFNNKVISKGLKVLLRNCYKETLDITSDDQTMKLFCWYPSCHSLYDVEFNIYKNGILIDKVLSYFGVAEFMSRGNTIYLNRSIIFPRLILDQGYYHDYGLSPTEEQIIEDIDLMKQIGLDGCRKHQKIECDLFYYYCDVLGFYLWQELPSAYEWKTNTINNLSKEWVDILYQHMNHPSIMAYVIINESWGTMAIGTHKQQQDFTKGLYYLTKSIDSSRFVISNDGWEHTISDLITVHNYSASKQELDDTYKDFYNRFAKDYRYIQQSSKRLCDDHHAFDEIKPVLMTEFAGIAFSKDKDIGWGYGDLVANEEQYLNRLKGQIDSIIESRVFSGFCITQLSDVQQEVNGLVDEKRNYKVDKNKLKEIISKKF